ncbi:MAG: hypothetical protein UY92_C0013G0026 [Candidatus Magasanikbacteria bacterium GW2011_GWA2_56_11]|uniref:Large ribosomal subunit protein bL35 n=1 Tax=Candidatus Magasanikbacteria bacterium GW2011_GWA2_56_11 TaxID=1619044 RepID=A0A0G2AKP7_9BACT|nr:MAG: hypothetical protein UY92_C0013G0026 [Candidatus Magasanikbacteria bacterium GW2011_GWA2_56_11]
MGKLKTNKAIAKRFVVKKSRQGTKVLKRTDGQDHFNSRESGKTKRNKRSDKTMTKTLQKTITTALPYA